MGILKGWAGGTGSSFFLGLQLLLHIFYREGYVCKRKGVENSART